MTNLNRPLRSHAMLWLFICSCNGISGRSQSEFTLVPGRAFQATFPAKDSFEYQLFGTTNFSDWFPASERIVACSSNETINVPMTNGPAVFYRGREYPPDLSRRLVNLTNVFLDTASTKTESNRLVVSGMRVESSDYNFNDYITATYDLDLCRQAFQLRSLDVVTNVGVTSGGSPFFFFKDSPRGVTVLNGSQSLPSQTSHTLISTGQTLYVDLEVGQVFSMVTGDVNIGSEFGVIMQDPLGKQLASYTVPSNTRFYHTPIYAVRPGRYSLQFVPQNTANVTVNFRFTNSNKSQITTIANGQVVSVSIADYLDEYIKFRVRLASGQTLRMAGPGEGASVTVYNSKGIVFGGRGGSGDLIFTAPQTDNYFVIYYHTDFQGHNYSTRVTISP